MEIRCIIIAFLFTSSLSSQEISRERAKSYEYNINKNSIIFDKDTYELIDMKDFNKLVESFPNSTLEVKDYDDYGVPTSYYFIKNIKLPEDSGFKGKIQINRKDIFNRQFDLEEMSNVKALIILQLDLELPMINVEGIKEAENAALKRENFISVILTTTNYNDAKEFAIIHNLNSVIIPNANTLINRFRFKRFPMFLVLDKNKSIISSTKYYDEVEYELTKLD